MKNKFLPILILSTLLLASCGALVDKVEPTAEATAAVEPTQPSDATSDEAAADTQEPLTTSDNPCVPFTVLDLSLTTPYPDLPPVSADDYIVGPDDAAMTFIVYSEPQCPYCAQFDPVLDEFQKMYPDDVRFVFRLRPFPESFHDKSLLASQALVAAGMQGKFNELRAFLFERQYQDTNVEEQAAMSADEFWAGLEPGDLDAWLEARVPDLGIDAQQLLTDMHSDEVVAKVQAFGDEASAIGVTGTPTLFVNGYQWPENSRGIEIFTIYLRLLKNKANEMDSCPATVIDDKKIYTATIATTQGDIEIELYPDKAPEAVNSFVYLAQEGWYDDLPILSSSDFILSGDPSDTGYGNAGYAFLDEKNDLTFDEAGMLATYSVWPGYGYNGSMFFINKAPLTGQENRVIFGKVTSGMEALDKIATRDNIFTPVADKVEKITINEK